MPKDKVFEKVEIIHQSYLKQSCAVLAQYSNYIVLILYGELETLTWQLLYPV